MEKSKKYISNDEAYTKITKWCAYQERAQQEVRDKLYDFGLNKEEVEQLLTRIISEGGQRQRICIARALSVQPSFLICDESVSALDVSVQAQVLNLLNELKEENNLTYIFISHDLSVVRYMSDTMIVMKNGKIEEVGEAKAVYEDPRSDYTKSLLSSIPH